MPTIGSLGDYYEASTEQSSSALRALAVAVIAACWLFLASGSADPAVAIENAKGQLWLTASLFLSVACLAFDVIQYTFAAIYLQRRLEVIDFLKRDSPWPTNSAREQILWNRARRYGLLKESLKLVGANSNLATADGIAELRRITRLGGGAAMDQLDTQLPDGLVAGSQRLFWTKLFLGLLGFVGLAVFFLTQLFF